MNDVRKPFHTRRLVVLLMAVAVLVPSLYGFGTKFLEFVALYRGEADGAFAISPILNYLLASLGFLFLFGWAVMSGMFRDVERPKYTMLENEALLDRRAPLPLKVAGGGLYGGRLAADSDNLRQFRFRGHDEHD